MVVTPILGLPLVGVAPYETGRRHETCRRKQAGKQRPIPDPRPRLGLAVVCTRCGTPLEHGPGRAPLSPGRLRRHLERIATSGRRRSGSDARSPPDGRTGTSDLLRRGPQHDRGPQRLRRQERPAGLVALRDAANAASAAGTPHVVVARALRYVGGQGDRSEPDVRATRTAAQTRAGQVRRPAPRDDARHRDAPLARLGRES